MAKTGAKKKPVTIWFVEPVGANVNLRISQLFNPDDACDEVLCADGNQHNLWRCSRHSQITQIRRTEGMIEGRDFFVWRRRDNGPIEKISFNSLKAQARKRREEEGSSNQPVLF